MKTTSRREIWAWALYDVANSSFTTLIVTFVFSAYFARRLAPDPDRGTILWTHAVNASALIVALGMPLLGALADAGGRKKSFLLTATAVAAIAAAGLFFSPHLPLAAVLIIFVIGNVAFEAGSALCDAFLPEIAPPGAIGRVSGFGWALGYAGGLVCLLLALGLIDRLPKDGAFGVRSICLLVALWYAGFALPFAAIVRERKPEHPERIALGTGFRRLARTLGELGRHRNASRLLVARLVYNDGLATVIAMAGIYAAARFGMAERELVVLGILVNVFGGIGAFAFGHLDDRRGGKLTIAISLVVLIFAALLGTLAESSRWFTVAACFVGLMTGPNQAASRSLFGKLSPTERRAEFFGFYAFSGKISSILGPLAYGAVLHATGDQRWAMGSLTAFFLVGLVLLMRVNEPPAESTGAA